MRTPVYIRRGGTEGRAGRLRHAVYTQRVYSPYSSIQNTYSAHNPLIYSPNIVRTQAVRTIVYSPCAAADGRAKGIPVVYIFFK